MCVCTHIMILKRIFIKLIEYPEKRFQIHHALDQRSKKLKYDWSYRRFMGSVLYSAIACVPEDHNYRNSPPDIRAGRASRLLDKIPRKSEATEKAGPFYGRACSRDRQLPGRQAALLFASAGRGGASPSSSSFPCPSLPLLLFHPASSWRFLKISRGTEGPIGCCTEPGRSPGRASPAGKRAIYPRQPHSPTRTPGRLAIYDPYPRDGAAHKYTSCARIRASSFLPSVLSFLLSFILPPSEKARLLRTAEQAKRLGEKLRIDCGQYMRNIETILRENSAF